jgi:peptide/nickel transport system substrate-binding protein
MAIRKNSLIIWILLSILIGFGISNIISTTYVKVPLFKYGVVIGTGAGPHTIDPMNSWDRASNNILDQIFEGLFTYDLSDPGLPRINLLAESYYWINSTTLQVKLREGVSFHDHYPLNAISAKWSFVRLSYMCNASNEANRMAPFNLTNHGSIAEPASLYFLPNGDPIIDNVEIVGTYNITFHLNGPFAPFLDLLCYEASKIMSPLSTPAIRFIKLYEVPVGTGPFKFVSFTSGVNVKLERNDLYWRPLASMPQVLFDIIPDTTTRNNALLSGQIDYLIGYSPSLLDTFRINPSTHVEEFSDDTGRPGLSYFYLGMNNDAINVTWRKAISYAINYTFLVKNIGNDLVLRATGPISPSYGAAYNISAKAAVENVTYARQVLVDAGITYLDVDNDAVWLAANLFSVNYTYNTDNQVRADIGNALTQWLDRIGITVIDDGVTWDDYLTDLFVNHDDLGIFWIGWGPDYLDPFNMLDPLFNPTSSSDLCQVDDAYLNSQMALALATTDDTARNNIYKNIQWYLAEELYPHAFGYHPKITTVHAANLRGVAYNVMGQLKVYSLYWE